MTDDRVFRVRYKGSEKYLDVRVIHTWRQDDWETQRGLDTHSGGVRETLHNYAVIALKQSGMDAVSLVVGNHTPLFLLRNGRRYYDVTGKECDVVRLGERGDEG